MSSIASRRVRVRELLKRASSHKLLQRGAELAIEPIREAYALAHGSPTLQPWAALAAYRLAHLVMRDPRARTAREVLEEVDALFAEAAREPGYFLDLDRAPLEGRGARPDEPLLRDVHWRLVGPEPSLADVSLAEGAALAELESLAPLIGATLVFRLPPDRSASAMKVGEAPWEMLPHRAARLLACVLRGGAPDARALTLQVMGGDGATHQTAFRQVRHRLADRLRAHGLLDGGDDIVVFAPPQPPRLAEGLVVLGAVSDAGYVDRE